MAELFKNIPKTVDEAVEQIIAEMSLQERIAAANLDATDTSLLEQLLVFYIQSKIEEWSVNEPLLKECVAKRPDKKMDDESTVASIIIAELWKRLQQTHKLRIVK